MHFSNGRYFKIMRNANSHFLQYQQQQQQTNSIRKRRAPAAPPATISTSLNPTGEGGEVVWPVGEFGGVEVGPKSETDGIMNVEFPSTSPLPPLLPSLPLAI